MSNICLGRLFYGINFSLSTNCHFQKIPENVVAITDLVEACTDSDILVFVVPHQLVSKLCGQLKGKVKQNAIAVSLIKVTLTIFLLCTIVLTRRVYPQILLVPVLDLSPKIFHKSLELFQRFLWGQI